MFSIPHPHIRNPHHHGRKQCFVTPTLNIDPLTEPSKTRTFSILVEDKKFYINPTEAAHSSPYFRAICEKSNNFYECQNNELKIVDECWEDVQIFLQCVTVSVNNLTCRRIEEKFVLTVLRLADRFMFLDTCKKCIEKIFDISRVLDRSIEDLVTYTYTILSYEINIYGKPTRGSGEAVIRFLKAIRVLIKRDPEKKKLLSTSEDKRFQKIDEVLKKWLIYCHSPACGTWFYCNDKENSCNKKKEWLYDACYHRVRPILMDLTADVPLKMEDSEKVGY